MAETSDMVLEEVQRRRGTWLSVVLATLVALYGITTAGAAFLANAADGQANDAYFNGVAFLNDANSIDLASLILELEDFRILDEIAIQETLTGDQELIDYIEAGLSSPAVDAIERSGFLDDGYYNELYGAADDFFESAEAEFQAAEALNNTADSFQLVVLVLAVGLSFVAWASLGEKVTVTRVLFVIMAVIIYILGTLGLFGVWLASPIALFG
ncbi:MAG: hypothetical protein GYB64_05375 [Chloroflexi bacterium]|nr:hypothetical protein [Chloroflexota bacterium]